jgi:hypothetical protein
VSIASTNKLFAVPAHPKPVAGTPKQRKTAASARAAKLAETQAKGVIDRAASVLDRLEERAAYFDELIDLLDARKRRALGRVLRIEEEILRRMDQQNIAFAPGMNRQFKANTCPVSVDVVDVTLIPAQYMRAVPPAKAAPDKRAIAEAIEAGLEVRGTRLVQNITLHRK